MAAAAAVANMTALAPPALGRDPSPLADHPSDWLAGARVAGGAVAAESGSTVACAALRRNFSAAAEMVW